MKSQLTILTDPLKINRREWSEFVTSHPDGNVFQTPEMFEVFAKSKGYDPVVIAVSDHYGITGLLLACIIRESGGKTGFFTSRSIVQGGPLIRNNDPVTTNSLLIKYRQLIRGRAIYSQFRFMNPSDQLTTVFKSQGFTFEDHLTILVDTSLPAEDLLKSVHKSRKRNLTKSVNKGTSFIEISSFDEVLTGYHLIVETYKRVGLPYPHISFMEAIYKVLYEAGFCRFFGAFIDKQMIGFRVMLCYNNGIYDYYAGSSDNHKNKYPNDLLVLNILKWACEGPYDHFNFGGAGKPGVPYGVRDYKMQFGGAVHNFGRSRKIHYPFLFYPAKSVFNLVRKFR